MGTMLGWVDTEEELQVTCRLLRHSCKFLQALVGRGVRKTGLRPSNWHSVWQLLLNEYGITHGVGQRTAGE